MPFKKKEVWRSLIRGTYNKKMTSVPSSSTAWFEQQHRSTQLRVLGTIRNRIEALRKQSVCDRLVDAVNRNDVSEIARISQEQTMLMQQEHDSRVQFQSLQPQPHSHSHQAQSQSTQFQHHHDFGRVTQAARAANEAAPAVASNDFLLSEWEDL